MAAFAGTASAQKNCETACPDKEGCKKEQCDKKCSDKDCKKEDCKKIECKGKEGKRCDKRECKKACPFEGLNLTEEQQVKIQDLDKAMKASKEEMKAQAKENKGENKVNPREAMKELRTKYLADLKNILTADQYTQFLQNFYVNQMPSRPNKLKADFNKMEKRVDKIAKDGKADFNKVEKRVVRDTKKIDKKVEKEAKKAEKK